MKKTLLILSMITLIFAGCKKFDEIEASKVEIVEEKIEKGWDYIKINVEYDYPVELESVTLYLSEKEDMSGAEAYECNVEGKKFSVEVEGLKVGMAYYYCYEYDNGYDKVKGKKQNINTVSKPVVITKEVSEVNTVSATLNGSVTNNDAINEISEMGFCWDTKQNPTIEGSHYNKGGMSGTGTSGFSYNLTSLQDNVTYYVRAYANTNYGIVYGEEKSFTTLERTFENGYEYVDLGLSVKWATCNVGAETPEEYSDYFAWGETTTKETYDQGNCPTYGLSYSELQSQGYIDGEGNLTPQYDAATANWGGDWRMPTKAEMQELIDECTWTWTTQNGVNGYKVTSKVNSNYIFLPATGYRSGSSLYSAGSCSYYWSSTPRKYYDDLASYLDFKSNNVHYMYDRSRFYGYSVRPVLE